MNIERYKNIFLHYTNNRFCKYGLPLFLFVCGGAYLFKEVQEVRYKYRKVKPLREYVSKEKINLPLAKESDLTLEAKYEELKKMDIDNWENKRIARPWEE